MDMLRQSNEARNASEEKREPHFRPEMGLKEGEARDDERLVLVRHSYHAWPARNKIGDQAYFGNMNTVMLDAKTGAIFAGVTPA
jgi:hypothetical protein